MHSSALGTSANGMSLYLHRSPSGAQRRIRQRLGDWPLQKSTNLSQLSNSNENLDSSHEAPSPSSSPYSNSQRTVTNVDSLGYRSLIESSDYRSVLADDYNASRFAAVESSQPPVEEKFSQWSLSTPSSQPLHHQPQNTFLNGSSISLNNNIASFGERIPTSAPPAPPPKPIPAPRSHDSNAPTPPQTLSLLNGRQRYNSGSEAHESRKQQQQHSFETPTSFNKQQSVFESSLSSFETNSTSPLSNGKLARSEMSASASQLPQSPMKPMLHVHPFPIPRAKPQPPPVPQKPKNLQTATRLKSIELADKSTNSLNELDVNQAYSSLDVETLTRLENQRIATLTTLYTKVSGRLEDLKNLHEEKKKNAQLFQHTLEVAQRHGIPTTPFVNFVRRFEAIYEVQTRLVLNKQQLRKTLEDTRDDDFFAPLIEQNDSNTQDIERIVDELDTTFRQLDSQLCEVLAPDQHERWVFFVRTLYSLIAEQTSIQFKVRYVSEQIKKLENFSFKQLAHSRSASSTHNTSTSSDTKDDCSITS